MIKFNETLKRLRIDKGFSIKMLAQLINVSPNTIISWEKGLTYPKSYNLIKIVKLFNVSCKYMLGV